MIGICSLVCSIVPVVVRCKGCLCLLLVFASFLFSLIHSHGLCVCLGFVLLLCVFEFKCFVGLLVAFFARSCPSVVFVVLVLAGPR